MFGPYLDTVRVSEAENLTVTREAFSASEAEKSTAVSRKERAMLLPTSEQSFLWHLKLIDDAKEKIDFMVYQNYSQDYTIYHYAALIRAADRGVKVRIITDGKMGEPGGTVAEIWELLQNHNNIEVYLFNPLDFLVPSGLMVFMHDKLTVVDGKVLICGGANMGTAAYLANLDMEVMITNGGENGAAAQALAYYEKMLGSRLTKRKRSKKTDKAALQKYDDLLSEFYGKSEIANEKVDYSEIGVPVDKCTVLSNRITSGKKPPIILKAIENLAKTAEKATFITPYLLLSQGKIDRLREIASKTPHFRIITNSLYNTRNIGYAAYRANRAAYVDKSIELLEFQEENQSHAKIYTFDGRYSVIGSFNSDERSAHIDTETVVIIDSEEFTSRLDEYIRENYVEKSLQVGENNEYIPSDAVKEGDVPGSKVALYRFLGFLNAFIYLL